MLPHLKNDVSVIMPAYNRGYIIREAVQSVLDQTYPYYDLYIIDDGSIDNTEDVIGALQDERIHYYRLETNHGANYARNYSL